MGKKRKRDRKLESNVDENWGSKRQRSSNGHRRSIAASSSRPHNADLEAAPTTGPSIHRAVERAIRILAPPAGLSLDQRKLWRELTRTAAATVVAHDVHPNTTKHSQGDSETHTPNRVKKARPAIRNSIRKDWSTTKLATTSPRKWHFEERNKFSLLSRVSPQSNGKERSMESDTSFEGLKSASSSDSESSVSRRSEKQESQITKAPESGEVDPMQAVAMLKRYNRKALHHDGHEGSNLLLTQDIPRRFNLRGPYLERKATSIPSYSGSMDTASAFARFTSFLHRGNEDSSEDEGEGSDNDSIREETGANGDRRSAQQPQLEADDIQWPSPTQDLLPSLDISVKEPNESAVNSLLSTLDDFKSPVFTRSAGTSTPPIKANVGIKRHGLFFERERVDIGKPQGRTADQLDPSSPAFKISDCVPVLSQDSDNESEDILQTIDEISRNIFASTRPLPASKLPLSPDPKYVDLENGRLTLASSNRRVTRSMSTPKRTPTHHSFFNIPIPQPTVVVCNSVRVPDLQYSPTTKREYQQPLPPRPLADEWAGAGDVESKTLTRESSSSSLSELSRSPSPPPTLEHLIATRGSESSSVQARQEVVTSVEKAQDENPASRRKRKMTGMTSKHFTPEKGTLRMRQAPKFNDELNGEADGRENPAAEAETLDDGEGTEPSLDAVPIPASTRGSAAKKRKGTGKKSSYFTPSKPPLDPNIIDRVDFYNSTGKKKRVPAGVSTAPVPPISSARFGIIQEKLWQEPFWLLIAVTFLNKTTGRAAAPVFWELKKRYPTPEELAAAELEDLHVLICHLGLQYQRSKRLIAIATAWVECPPQKGTMWRTLHYPVVGDGKAYKRNKCIEEDSEKCTGALEMGHIPGCGPYAYDSWRMFCRDILRGVAEDYNGKGADETFVPEWRKVLPLDKELRACLRWMWLRDGWIWNHETGEKRRATAQEMKMAEKGEMEVADDQERKFAAQAAAAENEEEELLADSDGVNPTAPLESRPRMAEDARFRTPEPENNNNSSDNIILSTPGKAVRRSARLTG